ncbi:mobilization protein, partial [Acinetobacter idrijaensis]
TNHALEHAGYRERIDHRSYADQGNQLQATIHEGSKVTQMRRKGIDTEISRFNDTIKQQNSQQLQNKQQHKEKTLEQGFNRVEQGFEQWKKAQEVQRLELEQRQRLKLEQEQKMKQTQRIKYGRSGPSL